MRGDQLSVSIEERPPLEWGSDAMAAALEGTGVELLALNPGASYRGLHDSLVNVLGNEHPAMLLCLHEEAAVAIAHGYAKVAERPMAVALHSNVGLMHATMALFNAFCDRVPMLVLGAAGPIDAAERRPWIDWIHTTADQGALIRDYCKWDDTPASVAAAVESIVRAHQLTTTWPCAPTYVCLDAALQEQPLPEPPPLPDPARHRATPPPHPDPHLLERAFALLESAERPLILAGRVSRSEEAWAQRVRLAEALGACVLTDLKVGAGFPTRHPLHPAAPGIFLTQEGIELLSRADAVLSLDWVDLAGTLQQAFGRDEVPARVVSCTQDHVLHNGWSKDHYALPPVDVALAAHPDAVVERLLAHAEASGGGGARAGWSDGTPTPREAPATDDGQLVMGDLAAALRRALDGRDACLVRLPLGWDGADLAFEHPLDYLGYDGGGGIGSGPGMAVGAALALEGSGRLPVAVIGDGDYLMGATALWTAAHYGAPLLVVIANNRSFYNDEMHQERVALLRGRPVENRWVGQHIREPAPDLAAVARGLGLAGHGPVAGAEQLDAVLAQAVAQAAAGEAVVVDVRVAPHGYPGGPGAVRSAEETGAVS